jgi:CBS domain-containing protein
VAVTVQELMSKRVVSARPLDSVATLRQLMERNWVHAIPVLGPQGEVFGIVTASELIGGLDAATPAHRIMSERVYKVAPETEAHIAAGLMRRHKLHHLIVTRGPALAGVLSAFDLLPLIEKWHFSRAERG